jgi:DNA-directed RNA polymerase specialized sigma24 family protein
VKSDFELLARFDASLGCQLSTFLGIIAKREAKQLLRSERRRRVREQGASRPDVSSADVRSDLNAAAEQEFLATLTPSERLFYTEFLLGSPEIAGAKDYSPSNVWQLTHRVKKKLNAFLFGRDMP